MTLYLPPPTSKLFLVAFIIDGLPEMLLGEAFTADFAALEDCISDGLTQGRRTDIGNAFGIPQPGNNNNPPGGLACFLPQPVVPNTNPSGSDLFNTCKHQNPSKSPPYKYKKQYSKSCFVLQ